jgi:hypothetical protein
LEPGQYYYYFIVDGENRYNSDCCTMTINEDQIVNFIEVPGTYYNIFLNITYVIIERARRRADDRRRENE